MALSMANYDMHQARTGSTASKSEGPRREWETLQSAGGKVPGQARVAQAGQITEQQ
jgi:hypothetical protein